MLTPSLHKSRGSQSRIRRSVQTIAIRVVLLHIPDYCCNVPAKLRSCTSIQIFKELLTPPLQKSRGRHCVEGGPVRSSWAEWCCRSVSEIVPKCTLNLARACLKRRRERKARLCHSGRTWIVTARVFSCLEYCSWRRSAARSGLLLMLYAPNVKIVRPTEVRTGGNDFDASAEPGKPCPRESSCLRSLG